MDLSLDNYRNDRQAVADYILWLGGFVCPVSVRERYKSLFSVLTERSFTSKIDMDRNRGVDGIALRFMYASQEHLPQDFWVGILPEECLIMEMLIALANRIECDFMHDPEQGNRMGVWFWEMLDNLGIADQDDLNFDEDYVQMRINILVDRSYERNGRGGLFPLRHPGRGIDQRKIELWYQMNHYISEKLRY